MSESKNHLIRIVIADDHAIFRDVLRRLLVSEKDFKVVAEASDGHEAVALARQHKPDVLLLDLAMPKVPGMEALRELAHGKDPVYTIVLTAEIDPSQVANALRLGARGIVLKASPPELLLKGIRSVSEGEYWVNGQLFANAARFSQEETFQPSLTSRELEIISAIRAGNSNKEIASKLSISEETVKRHLSNIFAKVGVSSRLELASLANRHDLGAK
jgi:DNA-binding NarL/FixJ family response regulator